MQCIGPAGLGLREAPEALIRRAEARAGPRTVQIMQYTAGAPAMLIKRPEIAPNFDGAGARSPAVHCHAKYVLVYRHFKTGSATHSAASAFKVALARVLGTNVLPTARPQANLP